MACPRPYRPSIAWLYPIATSNNVRPRATRCNSSSRWLERHVTCSLSHRRTFGKFRLCSPLRCLSQTDMSTEHTDSTVPRKRPRTIPYVAADLNSQMHDRNMYKTNPPDFAALADQFEAFRSYVKFGRDSKPYIDFKNAEAVRELTYCLLRQDFSIELNIPLDTLCPTIPNRLNYILWLEDLIQNDPDVTPIVRGIDIGTGASCIYPLLGCTTNKCWTFLATDIDDRSLACARANVTRNGLDDRIRLYLNKDPEKVLPLDESERELEELDTGTRYTFCMCNPPFYESLAQIEEGVNGKELPPSAVCTGTNNEMITPGGEFQFIMHIVQESLMLRERVSWYTSMIGRRETLDKVVAELKKLKIDNYVVTEFCQGRTRRWGIGWSFGDQRPPSYRTDPTVPLSKKLKRLAPPTTLFRAPFSSPLPVVQTVLRTLLDSLEARGGWNAEGNEFVGSVGRNTWSRAARRKAAAATAVAESGGDGGDAQVEAKAARGEVETLFEFKCKMSEVGRDGADDETIKQEAEDEAKLEIVKIVKQETEERVGQKVTKTEVVMTWTAGKDREMFVSFWNHVKKRLEQGLETEADGLKQTE